MARALAKKTAGAKRGARTGMAPKKVSSGTKSAVKKTALRASVANKPAAKKGLAVRSVRPAATVTAADAQTLAHRLNELLHTMQAVQQYEERLCSLMHALRRGRTSRPLLVELRGVLEQLPAHDYLHEVDALRDAVAA